jgi:integrase
MSTKHPDFSVKRIDGFQCKPGKAQTLYWDGYAPGLGVRVTTAGSKSYIFESWLHGRSVRVTIGDVRTWTLGKAQDEATRLKTMTDQGKDPRRVKKEEAEAAAAARFRDANAAMLVGEAWTVYLTANENLWGAHHKRGHLEQSHPGGVKKKVGAGVTVPGPMIPILKLRLAEVTAQVLTEWIKGLAAKRKARARQSFQMFRAFWRWCGSRPEYKSVIDVTVIDDKDLRRQVPKGRTKLHDVLQRAHLRPWFEAVQKIPNPIMSAYLQGLLLTGARREELAELKWADVDFKYHSLWIKDKVSEEGRKIPLTPHLARLLSALPRKNKWVFRSQRSAAGRLTSPRMAHTNALKEAKLDHVTLHGLRRTFSSLAEWVEIPVGVVAQIMGHTPKATAEQHYKFRPLELLAVWHNKFETWILRQAGVIKPKKKRSKQRPPIKAPPRLRLVGNG